MTCRHGPSDPDCSSHPNHVRYQEVRSELGQRTPDASNYTIEAAERVGLHLVMKVKYPNCASCAYEGNKVMVFLNVTELDVIRWKRIDPHFRPTAKGKASFEAPSPAARFPGTPDGWTDAITYARGKSK
jgi:hypothetical protein